MIFNHLMVETPRFEGIFKDFYPYHSNGHQPFFNGFQPFQKIFFLKRNDNEF